MQEDNLKKNSKWSKLIWSITLLLWGLVAIGLISLIVKDGKIPIDESTYFHALEQFKNEVSPYNSSEENQDKWRNFHKLEEQILANSFEGIAYEDIVVEDIKIDEIAGPFIYPPTLLQLMDLIKITPIGFIVLLLFSLLLFSWLWLKVSKMSAWWLIMILFSWDVMSSFSGGNVEIILLTSTLLSAYLLFTGRSIWAAPFIAFVIVVKPFYGLFFASLGLFMLATNPKVRSANLRSLIISASSSIVLLIVAVLLWPEWLRPHVFDYLRDGLAHSWYILPLSDQTPMSIWNRTFMQGLVNLGISAKIAQTSSVIVWSIITGITITQIWKKSLPFPILFAFSFLLFYWFRPVGWGLIFLDIVILTAVWPYVSTQLRRWLLVGTILFAISHWVAFILSVDLFWLRIFTLQSATLPWETWLVFPICWAILLYSARKVPQLNQST